MQKIIYQDLIEFLQKVSLFSSVPTDQIREIAGLFEKKFYHKGDIIFRQGEPGDSMYVIRSGMVSVHKEEEGRKLFVSELKRGDFFGEMSLLSESPRNSTVEASLDVTLFCLTRENFDVLIKTDKSIGLYLSRFYAKRMSILAKGDGPQAMAPTFYAVSATGPELGVSHFLYSVSFHISDESHKRVVVIEPHLEADRIMLKYDLAHMECPTPDLFRLLPPSSYKPEDIHWYKHLSGFHVLQLRTGFSDRLSEIMPVLMAGLKDAYDVVFFNLTHCLNDMERLFVRLCDRTFLLIHNTEEKIGEVRTRLLELEQICGASAFLGRIRVGVSHLYGKCGVARQELKQRLGLCETPGIWVDRSEPAFKDRIDTHKCFPVRGARAVAREIAGIRLGLALGAGGARGWAHIGVLKVLEDAGIHIDMISGTSMGALVGGIYAATASFKKLKKSTIDQILTRADTRRKIFDYTLPKQGLLRGKKAAQLIRKAVSNADFLDLMIPTYLVGVDILNEEEVIIETGDVTDAIRSSIAIPAVFSPFKHQGRWMVDGGLLNPVPVDVLIRKGADMAIAVSIESKTANTVPQNKDPGIKEIISRAISIVHGRATRDYVKNADLVLYPDVGTFAWDDFHEGLALMHRGMEECLGRLPDIQRMINEKHRRTHLGS
ncbi:cyclic nucleotide-binding and patatin-like phospholipase domain-containing protein [uncultured Desulfobacter sp.]|uniref:cyclic nucleotide-binding and patatin-like phospholipase domain-containing protein n=1 Tax=uncultured Desulfobacter sp. TaxID=240139 RepID=UPI002AABF762|nr:cyclic nucleotide-binding and patatin-like phospholipase domain-containing protein [uncultured Desulfobacter sp.]